MIEMTEVNIIVVLATLVGVLWLMGVFLPNFIAEFLQDDWYILPKWLRAMLRGLFPNLLDILMKIWDEFDRVTDIVTSRTDNKIDDRLQDMVDAKVREHLENLKTLLNTEIRD